MFGKASWFREKRIGWGLTPVTWQGWVYTLVWTAVLLVPFYALILRGQVVESLIWMAAAILLLIWDVWQIIRAGRAAPSDTTPDSHSDVLYIGDDATDDNGISTPNYDLHVRR